MELKIMKRSQYLNEFKIQVCKEAINIGNAAKIARQYELCPKMVNRWVQEYKGGKYCG
jgi:transposase-like protein